MVESTSSARLPKYLVTLVTASDDQVVEKDNLVFVDKLQLDNEHPNYDCGVHDDFSFEPDSLAWESSWYQFKKFNGTSWVDIPDPRTPDQLCEKCALHVHDIKQYSRLKKKEEEVDYYEGDWSTFPALQ